MAVLCIWLCCKSTKLIKRFQITSESFIVFLFSVLSFLLFLHLSEPPFAPANVQHRNTISHQTSHTCGSLPLVMHLIYFKLIWITILDLEPNPDFQTLLIISKTNQRSFSCDTSKRRSGQVLPFIFFELRAPACQWGRYDATLFCIYLLPIQSLLKTCYTLV